MQRLVLKLLNRGSFVYGKNTISACLLQDRGGNYYIMTDNENPPITFSLSECLVLEADTKSQHRWAACGKLYTVNELENSVTIKSLGMGTNNYSGSHEAKELFLELQGYARSHIKNLPV